jgi:hypothetical protein
MSGISNGVKVTEVPASDPQVQNSTEASAGDAVMNIPAPFINRPIATALLMVAIVLLGGIGYRLLPVSSLPNVAFPTISVTAQMPGTDPLPDSIDHRQAAQSSGRSIGPHRGLRLQSSPANNRSTGQSLPLSPSCGRQRVTARAGGYASCI